MTCENNSFKLLTGFLIGTAIGTITGTLLDRQSEQVKNLVTN